MPDDPTISFLVGCREGCRIVIEAQAGTDDIVTGYANLPGIGATQLVELTGDKLIDVDECYCPGYRSAIADRDFRSATACVLVFSRRSQ